METNESKQDYLERILMLEDIGKKPIKAINIANLFNYSRASVSIALKKLKEDNLILIDEHQNISLTKEGRDIASKIYERHQILSKLFSLLGVDKEIALKDACKIEHDLSDETFNVLKNLYNEIKNK